MTVKPKFYVDFRCIADRCTDTCCAHWEIDVDGDTAEYYRALDGEDGDFVRSRLTHTEDGCVRLCNEGERCPFLRDDNLCEMIIRLGDNSLCDICREHPRFYSGSDNITEVGVGLCCEEATRLWLRSPCEFIFEDDGDVPEKWESELLSEQMALIHTLTHGDGTLGERIAAQMEGGSECEGLYTQLRGLYSDLEVLDPSFGGRFSEAPTVTEDARFSALAAYFVYRYYYELGWELTLRFTAASLIMLAAMDGELHIKAKDFSKEVEYDTDNLERIYGFLEEASGLGELTRRVLAGR